MGGGPGRIQPPNGQQSNPGECFLVRGLSIGRRGLDQQAGDLKPNRRKERLRIEPNSTIWRKQPNVENRRSSSWDRLDAGWLPVPTQLICRKSRIRIRRAYLISVFAATTISLVSTESGLASRQPPTASRCAQEEKIDDVEGTSKA